MEFTENQIILVPSHNMIVHHSLTAKVIYSILFISFIPHTPTQWGPKSFSSTFYLHNKPMKLGCKLMTGYQATFHGRVGSKSCSFRSFSDTLTTIPVPDFNLSLLVVKTIQSTELKYPIQIFIEWRVKE